MTLLSYFNMGRILLISGFLFQLEVHLLYVYMGIWIIYPVRCKYTDNHLEWNISKDKSTVYEVFIENTTRTPFNILMIMFEKNPLCLLIPFRFGKDFCNSLYICVFDYYIISCACIWRSEFEIYVLHCKSV